MMSEESIKTVEVEYAVAPTAEQMEALEGKIGQRKRTGFPHTFVSEEGNWTFRIRPFIDVDGSFCFYRSIYASRFPAKENQRGGFAMGNSEIKELCEAADRDGYTKAWMWKPRKQYLVLVHLYNCPTSKYVEPGTDTALILGHTQFQQLESTLENLKKYNRFKECMDVTKPCVPFDLTVKPDPSKPKGKIISVQLSLNPEPMALPPMQLPEGVEWEGNLDKVFVPEGKHPTAEQMSSLKTLLNKEVMKIKTSRIESTVQPSQVAPENRGHEIQRTQVGESAVRPVATEDAVASAMGEDPLEGD